MPKFRKIAYDGLQLGVIHGEDCLDTMKRVDDSFVDLVITSPPYDNLRKYGGYNFEFEDIVNELYRIVKVGGCIVWVVNDATIKGTETGTCFRQALYFMKVGFRLHDTMIWHKTNPMPTQHVRYENSFEYMFVFSKGKPCTHNILREKAKCHGSVRKKHRA